MLQYLMFFAWMLVSIMYSSTGPVTPLIKCPEGTVENTGTCSHRGYVIPGFPTRETWTRQPEAPAIFYGKAVYYADGVMWATALTRGFDREYLVQFDCLLSGFFINDVGRVAWLLHNSGVYRCLVVDNAHSKDLFKTVIINREAAEVEFDFYHEHLSGEKQPIVGIAYQIEEPTPQEWMTAEPLDKYLFDRWESSLTEPKGWIQIKHDQQAWYLITGGQALWTRVPGCLYCLDGERYGFVEDEFEWYYIEHGDSLDLISKKMYGYSHPRFWAAIYEANKDRMKDEYYIRVGMQIRIPVWKEFDLGDHLEHSQ